MKLPVIIKRRSVTFKMDFSMNKDPLGVGEITDPTLKQAVEEAVSAGSPLPLTKLILHDSILDKRMKQGLPECMTETTKPPVTYKLTDEEEHKREKKRESNKKAARKYRCKQKELQRGMLQLIDELKGRIKKLEAEKRQLQGGARNSPT